MRVILKFFNVESLTNQREFYFAGRDGPRGSNPPKWNKMEQSIDHLSAFISFSRRTNNLAQVLVNIVKTGENDSKADGLGETEERLKIYEPWMKSSQLL